MCVRRRRRDGRTHPPPVTPHPFTAQMTSCQDRTPAGAPDGRRLAERPPPPPKRTPPCWSLFPTGRTRLCCRDAHDGSNQSPCACVKGRAVPCCKGVEDKQKSEQGGRGLRTGDRGWTGLGACHPRSRPRREKEWAGRAARPPWRRPHGSAAEAAALAASAPGGGRGPDGDGSAGERRRSPPVVTVTRRRVGMRGGKRGGRRRPRRGAAAAAAPAARRHCRSARRHRRRRSPRCHRCASRGGGRRLQPRQRPRAATGGAVARQTAASKSRHRRGMRHLGRATPCHVGDPRGGGGGGGSLAGGGGGGGGGG
ncbi:hypothetical protein I4F81_012159 [Pyropia yezoensis]|uniref:Uncharacterized protein n=1 Tax=Pyropia yezoensis TaxID=2788 RepID=A0ACC3CIC0_PYRYE|nr:hypothetical protein I4F81_012159 [Neopyropia yezoensis]